MTASRGHQTAFSSGEIDPRLHAREDFIRHQSGLAACCGFLPMRQGGVTRAPGTIFKGTTRANAAAVRLPFVFAADDAVELEFSAGKMRVWRYGALVMRNGAPYELDTPFGAADLPNLTAAQDADVMYLLDGRHPMQQLTRLALDSWTLAPAALEAGPFRAQNLDEDITLQCLIDGQAIAAWSDSAALVAGDLRSNGGRVYRFVNFTTTAASGLNEDDRAVPPSHTSGTVAYFFSYDPAPQELTEANWTFVADVTATETVTLRASQPLFTSEHVGALMLLEPEDWTQVPIWVGNTKKARGSLIRYDGNVYQLGKMSGSGASYSGGDAELGVNPPVHSAGVVRTDANQGTVYRHVSTEQGIVEIASITSPTEAVARVVEPVPQPIYDDPTYRWSIGAWNALHAHPRFIAWHEQRMFAAGADTEPRTVSASAQGAYRSFLPGSEAPDAFSYDIGGAGSRNAILWLLSSKRGIFIGTLGEVRRGHGGGTDEPIGPTTFRADLVAPVGSAPIQPAAPFGWPIYISRDRARVFEVRFNLSQDEMRPLELSLPSAHLGAAGFRQIVWQSAPEETGWLRRADGTLAVLTYDPDQDVLGWSWVPVAGGFVEHLSVSPSADGAQDVVTAIVRREIDGQTLRCVEELATPRPDTPVLERNHAFCSVEIAAAQPTTEFNVPHLAGETVAAWTDEGGFEGLTVGPEGAVTLPLPATRAIIGLFDDTHRIQTLPLRAAARDGDSRGRKRQLKRGTGIMVLDTAGGTVRTLERHAGQSWQAGAAHRLFERSALSDHSARSGTLDTDATTGMADEVALEIRPQGLTPLTLTGIIAAIDEEGA
jgi:hypothetical protein